MTVAARAQARVQPYYIVAPANPLRMSTRIVFVLDTSGSMAYRPDGSETYCDWDDCEGDDPTTMSRIRMARNAIRELVDAHEGSSEFSLMSFRHLEPPTGRPTKCEVVPGTFRRFTWIDQYAITISEVLTWFNFPGPNTGRWVLCEQDYGNRPYPYLRWDNLGAGSVVTADDQSGPVPPSPLISMDPADYPTATNGRRKVQWFPQFMGIRAQLNDATDPGGLLLARTYGDHGNSAAARAANVWEQDFYYWPYVDGFPGYSVFKSSLESNLGVSNRDNAAGAPGATLWAPFHLDLASSGIPAGDRGPTTVAEATEATRAHTRSIMEGGLDIRGRTNWSQAIGSIPAVAPAINRPHGQESVAEYLKFVRTTGGSDVCRPLAAVLLTDGNPGVVGGGLNSRIAALRKELDVRVFVVGFLIAGSELNNMACAGAGACDGDCDTPCDDLPENSWDTCRDPSAPATDCAYVANSTLELSDALQRITRAADLREITAGPGARIHSHVVDESDESVSSDIAAYTEWPSWRGHVTRAPCTDPDPDDPTQPAPWCAEPALSGPTFGPCPLSSTWDAGECLQLTNWRARRLYSAKADGTPYPVYDASTGLATPEFHAEAAALGLFSSSSDPTLFRNKFVRFMLGKGWSWKLAGLANSAPTPIRRIAPMRPGHTPTVAIRDFHCAGRTLREGEATLPSSLESFARDAWDPAQFASSPSPHSLYQEAVLVGDDLGQLHAFHLDSGNELWAFIPRFMLSKAVDQFYEGAAAQGQPDELDAHHYGIAAPVNQGWVYDTSASRWRHVAIFGFGAGGYEYVALDVSHMSPSAPVPFDVLWSTEDAALKTTYDAYNGETWARPALTYRLSSTSPGVIPEAYVLMTSGYPDPASGADNGHRVVLADALTGAVVESARLSSDGNGTYESEFGYNVDPAVTSHCLSKMWPEMQEVYLADGSGRIHRWDQGDYGTALHHDADSGGTWAGTAQAALANLWACTGQNSCNVVKGTSGGGMREPFTFAPAVTAIDRIDDFESGGSAPLARDEFLLALIGGHADDDAVPLAGTSPYHSSIYVLVDDHRVNRNGGLTIPSGMPLTSATDTSYPKYFRTVLSAIGRTRTFSPFPGAPTYTDPGTFAETTRPIRSPRIKVGPVFDAQTNRQRPELEAYTITFTVHEPAAPGCDSRWYDAATKRWHTDQGSVYEIDYRLIVDDTVGFDLANGGGGAEDFGAGFDRGLTLVEVRQVTAGDCDDGVCAPTNAPPKARPCTEGFATSDPTTNSIAVPFSSAQLAGFTPQE